MKCDELLKQPNGIIFCENDMPLCPLFKKVGTTGDNDILIRGIFHPVANEDHRLGLREMDDTEKNSIDYHVLTDEELITARLEFTI